MVAVLLGHEGRPTADRADRPVRVAGLEPERAAEVVRLTSFQHCFDPPVRPGGHGPCHTRLAGPNGVTLGGGELRPESPHSREGPPRWPDVTRQPARPHSWAMNCGTPGSRRGTARRRPWRPSS